MQPSLSPRIVFIGLLFLAIASMLFARLYLQAFLGLDACPLCMTQRVIIVLAGLFGLLAALHNPTGWGLRVYAALSVLAAAVGGAVAARHVWLQHLPEDQVPACGPDLAYMFEAFPLGDVLIAMTQGTGDCAEVTWSFLGLSIPGWALLSFVAILVMALLQLRAAAR